MISGHAVHRGLDQLDRREHVGIHRPEPGLAVPVPEIAGRRAAGIGHDNVVVPARSAGYRPDRLAAFRRGDVGGHGQHLDFAGGFGAQAQGAGLQGFCPARHHDHIHAFEGERTRATPDPSCISFVIDTRAGRVTQNTPPSTSAVPSRTQLLSGSASISTPSSKVDIGPTLPISEASAGPMSACGARTRHQKPAARPSRRGSLAARYPSTAGSPMRQMNWPAPKSW